MNFRFKKFFCLLSMFSILCFSVNAELEIIKYKPNVSGYGKKEITNFVSLFLKNKSEAKEFMKNYFTKNFDIFICVDSGAKSKASRFVGVSFEPSRYYDTDFRPTWFVRRGFDEFDFLNSVSEYRHLHP